MLLPTRHVGNGKPLHERRQLTIVLRPENQVPMIWHGEVITMPSLADLCSRGFSSFSWWGWSVQLVSFVGPVDCDRRVCEAG